MADLVTHLSSVLLPSAFLPSSVRRYAGVLAVGVILPDLAGSVPGMAFSRLQGLGVPVPDLLFYPTLVLHMPVGITLMAGLLSSLFVAGQRRAVFLGLLAGGGAHLLLDLLQDHHGVGYALVYPFSSVDWEVGWLGTEATVGIALPLGLVTLLAWLWRLRTDERH